MLNALVAFVVVGVFLAWLWWRFRERDRLPPGLGVVFAVGAGVLLWLLVGLVVAAVI